MRWLEAQALTAIASSNSVNPAQCSRPMWPRAISAPPLAAPMAWPANIADELLKPGTARKVIVDTVQTNQGIQVMPS